MIMNDDWLDSEHGQDWLDHRKVEKQNLEELLKEIREGKYK